MFFFCERENEENVFALFNISVLNRWKYDDPLTCKPAVDLFDEQKKGKVLQYPQVAPPPRFLHCVTLSFSEGVYIFENYTYRLFLIPVIFGISVSWDSSPQERRVTGPQESHSGKNWNTVILLK